MARFGQQRAVEMRLINELERRMGSDDDLDEYGSSRIDDDVLEPEVIGCDDEMDEDDDIDTAVVQYLMEAARQAEDGDFTVPKRAMIEGEELSDDAISGYAVPGAKFNHYMAKRHTNLRDLQMLTSRVESLLIQLLIGPVIIFFLLLSVPHRKSPF